MELDEAMRTAWTNRYYTEEPVKRDVLHGILEAARFAPSGGNRQGWRVIAVLDKVRRLAIAGLYRERWAPYRARLEPLPDANQPPLSGGNPTTCLATASLRGADHFAATLHEIPVHLIICVDLTTVQIPDRELDRPSINGGASIYPFAHNILLATRARGLGAALTTLICASEPEVKDMLGIPERYAVAALLTVGHPSPERIPTRLSRRPVEEFATLEAFDGMAITR